MIYRYAALSGESSPMMCGTIRTTLEGEELTIYILSNLAKSALLQKMPWDPFNVRMLVQAQKEP